MMMVVMMMLMLMLMPRPIVTPSVIAAMVVHVLFDSRFVLRHGLGIRQRAQEQGAA
jgi:hypothetical protein